MPLYLANTRTLAILEIRNHGQGTTPRVKDKVLSLLREEIQILAQCVELPNGLELAKPNANVCENQERLKALIAGVREVGEVEKRIKEHEKVLRQ